MPNATTVIRPTDTPYERQIASDFDAMRDLLAGIAPPAGHHWTTGAGDPLRWYAGSIAESTRWNASISLGRVETDDHDTTQLHIEVRLGWDDVGRIGKGNEPASRRAIVWCQMGPRINFTSRSLLDQTAKHLSAPDIPTLFVAVETELRRGLQTYRALLPDHLVDLLVR